MTLDQSFVRNSGTSEEGRVGNGARKNQSAPTNPRPQDRRNILKEELRVWGWPPLVMRCSVPPSRSSLPQHRSGNVGIGVKQKQQLKAVATPAVLVTCCILYEEAVEEEAAVVLWKRCHNFGSPAPLQETKKKKLQLCSGKAATASAPRNKGRRSCSWQVELCS